MLRTVTLLDVQIAPAVRTQSLALFAAQGAYRRGQQNLLAEDIFQQKTLALIIADFGFRLADGRLIPAAIHTQRPVDQIKTLVYVVRHRIETASATELQFRRYAANQANVFDVLMMAAMLHNQLGPAFATQRSALPELRPKFDHAGLEVFIKLQLSELQFPNTNQHSNTGPRYV